MNKCKCLRAGAAGGLLLLAGCANANRNEDFVAVWMAEMDAKPAAEQVPNWENTRTLMTRQPPQPGEVAPDFALESRDGDGEIRLSEFRAARPVVLIFGSWT